MPRLTRDSNVSVGTKEFKVDDILKTIIYLPANQVKSFFIEIGLTIPREMRMFVLRETLREKVIETRKSRLTLADELNYRLSWFTEFTETQLENLLIFFDDPVLDKAFLEDFWTDLISYMVEKGVTPKDLKKILDLSIQHVRAVGLELPNMKTYNRELKDLFFDSMGRIDGLPPQKIRPVLYKSSTLTEVRDLGSKYDVDVPRRLKKTELADIIVKELKDRGQHTDELETQIRSMSVIVMQRFAIDHDIKASTELKKEEIIEYILANAKETKEAYFVPESPQVYEKEVEEVSKHVEEVKVVPQVVQVVEEPVEEIKESVSEDIVEENPVVLEEVSEVEEKVEEAPKQIAPVQEVKGPVQYVQSQVDLSSLVNEIRLLRQSIEALAKQPETVEEKVKEKELPEPVLINTAEFYGNPKSLKKIIKNDEADEREKFVEDKKQASSIGTDKNDDEIVPAELRFFKKVGIGLGKFFLKFFKVLLKVALILLGIALLLFLLYGILAHFTDIAFLAPVDQFLDNLFGLGLLTKYTNLLGSIFG
ncbi:MAG: hypothetical protein A2Y45_05970 [Tenericutes bacterium GWC2_34_14]|nr:MAG: hypothetical protein A2Z84_04830 [Tenericutes bacterium GWA2_35_7]OHE28501.1 MAG: hypothetical protein A2Y45_05970 [Tenericutes bacterium GWC2_34_14]OHE33591.1 MAG: hypothetical protein A2012_03840 [Tenericutes bacterium GWE2_34_108]OHE36876.1 MAG: hypothetical protein A2Y46_09640 [Tenericutes bacterium GWF1_35_14]OHE38044.1 MAG: hypothetical protein A2Y44_09025 [Tenericutes bacterium GWF2_35_184]OHE43439.1 MAG: hypothetical protein A2221_06710 [Tenericutes bacterium RIFOXYA2_FULL_36_3